MNSESLFQYLDGFLDVRGHPDYPGALNGLQVAGPDEVRHVCAAVDASEAAIAEAIRRGADVLLVHHGLFWEGLRPLTGRRYRKVARLVEGRLAVYSAHLPLDSHPDVGNCILLARLLGLEVGGRFGSYEGTPIGWWGTADLHREELRRLAEERLGGPVTLVPGGPERVRRVGVLTGGGGSFVGEAARAGLDAYVTGEGSHHTVVDAMELGVDLYYGGHYATETSGVRELARHLHERFGVTWEFVDLPTGL